MHMSARNEAARFPTVVATGLNAAEPMPVKTHSNLTPVRPAHVSVAGINERQQKMYKHISLYITATVPLARYGMWSREATSFTQTPQKGRGQLGL